MYQRTDSWVDSSREGFVCPLTNHCAVPWYHPHLHFPSTAQRSFFRELCCLVAFQTLFYPSLNLLSISFPLLYPVALAVSYTQQLATTLSNKCHKRFVRGSLKLLLINLYPVLMSFVTSNLAGIESWIFTATPLMFLFGLIKCRWRTEWGQVTLSTSAISEVALRLRWNSWQ